MRSKSCVVFAGSPSTGAAHRRRRSLALSLLAAFLSGQGCFAYHTVELPGLVPGEEVRLELAESEYRRVAPGGSVLGPRRIEGRFGGLERDSLRISVWIGEGYTGTPFASAYQDLMIPRAEVSRAESRRLSTKRTVLASAAVVLGVAVLIDSIGLVEIFGIGNGGDGPPAPPVEGAVLGR